MRRMRYATLLCCCFLGFQQCQRAHHHTTRLIGQIFTEPDARTGQHCFADSIPRVLQCLTLR